MTKRLHLSPDLDLPIDATTQKIAFLARSGAGKTYAAGKLVEELAAAKQQFVVVDGIGTWWGLRLAANGKDPGIRDVVIFGGDHQDVPLEPTGGKLVAQLVVEHGMSVVLDVSPFTGGDQRRFVKDFAIALLHEKKKHRSPLMVVWEECQDFVPQHVTTGTAEMVGAMERLIKQGRNFGIGTTLISQRPQAVNKDVLNQTECLVVLQMTGPQERKTILGWVVEKGADVAKAVDELPSLTRGQAFLWSPAWLKVFQRITIGKKWTFDASSTPEFGKAAVARELAPVDLVAVREAMAETIERARADDPKSLRLKISQLEREVRELKMNPPAAKVERIEVPVFSKLDLEPLSHCADSLEALQRDAGQMLGIVRGEIDLFHKQLRDNIEKRKPPIAKAQQPAHTGMAGPRSNNRPAISSSVRDTELRKVDGLSKPQQKILDGLAFLHTAGVTRGAWSIVAFLGGQSPKSSGFEKNISVLRSANMISGGRGDGLQLIADGKTAANWPHFADVEDLQKQVLAMVSGPQRVMLDYLILAHPETVAWDTLALHSGQSPKSSGFEKNVSVLRSLGLVSGGRSEPLGAMPVLFLEGA